MGGRLRRLGNVVSLEKLYKNDADGMRQLGNLSANEGLLGSAAQKHQVNSSFDATKAAAQLKDAAKMRSTGLLLTSNKPVEPSATSLSGSEKPSIPIKSLSTGGADDCGIGAHLLSP